MRERGSEATDPPSKRKRTKTYNIVKSEHDNDNPVCCRTGSNWLLFQLSTMLMPKGNDKSGETKLVYGPLEFDHLRTGHLSVPEVIQHSECFGSSEPGYIYKARRTTPSAPRKISVSRCLPRGGQDALYSRTHHSPEIWMTCSRCPIFSATIRL